MAAGLVAPPGLVQTRLAQHGIHVTLEWVVACVEWLQEEQPSLSREQVVAAVEEQYLSTDILQPGVMDRPVLPSNLETIRLTTLPGNLVLMVEQGLDIGNPAYGQLQKLHKVDTENARVGGDETDATQTGYQATQGGRFAAAWEPKPSRALYITLTDGFHKVKALEVEPLSQMPDWPRPGTKLQLKGPLNCRRGVILLKKDQCTILGGEAEELLEENTPRKVLESRIGRQDVGQSNPFASVPIQREDNPPQIVQQQNPNQQNVRQPQCHQQQMPLNQNRYQQPDQRINHFQSYNYQQGDEDDFPEDEDLSQFAVEEPNQHPIHTNDFPDDDLDDGDLLLAASQVEDPGTVGTSIAAWKSSTSTFSDASKFSTHPATVFSSTTSRSTGGSTACVGASFNTSSVSLSNSFSPTNANRSCSNTPAGASTSKSTIPVAIVSPAFSSPVEKSRAAPDLENIPKIIGRDPWTYISLLLPILQARQPFKAKVKVVSATLASKISLKKSSTGPTWSLSIVINDGSGSLTVPLSPSLLDLHLGSAAAYTSAVKVEFKEKSKALSKMLAGLSALLTLETFNAEPGSPLTTSVTAIEELTGLHLAQMRKRRVMTP